MLKFKDQVRFTASEIEQCRQIGIDLVGVKTNVDYSNAVIELITTLERERPELLEKIFRAIAARTELILPGKS
jgi:iron uptake system EfeUOB component EfeO/EfeM